MHRTYVEKDTHFLSYPGSGRNWMTMMVGKYFQLYYRLKLKRVSKLLGPEGFPQLDDRVPQVWFSHDDRPYLETVERIQEASKRKYTKCKVVLIARDPRDSVISCYHKHRYNPKFVFGSMEKYTGSLSEYLRDEHHGIAGAVAWLNKWAEEKDTPADFLLVRYEDMKRNALRELETVVAFIDLGLSSVPTATQAEAFARFDNIRSLEESGLLNTGMQSGERRSLLTRKGKAGGYEDVLDDEDVVFASEAIEQLHPMYGYLP